MKAKKPNIIAMRAKITAMVPPIPRSGLEFTSLLLESELVCSSSTERTRAEQSRSAGRRGAGRTVAGGTLVLSRAVLARDDR